MASNLKTIRSRTKSVKNIRKITRAMELVSVSKMRRAVSAVQASRPYAKATWNVLRRLTPRVNRRLHPLLRIPPAINNVLLVAVSSDRGLCGSFNLGIIEKITRFIEAFYEENGDPERRIEIIAVGKKIEEMAVRMKWNLIASFRNLSVVPSVIEVQPISRIAIDGFKGKKYDRVFIIYTDFISTVKQTPVVHRLLPLEYDENLENGGTNFTDQGLSVVGQSPKFKFIFEPAADQVLECILPRAIEVQIYHAILESVASEHSARMIAMKNASDAARDMVQDLTFTLNQARQAMITREIAEIVTGKAAVE